MYVFKLNFAGHDETRIHGVGCPFARPAGYRTGATRWFPQQPNTTYPKLGDAIAAARALGMPNGPYVCKHCKRDGRIK